MYMVYVVRGSCMWFVWFVWSGGSPGLRGAPAKLSAGHLCEYGGTVLWGNHEKGGTETREEP